MSNDLYAYFEDDLIVLDPWFFHKMIVSLSSWG